MIQPAARTTEKTDAQAVRTRIVTLDGTQRMAILEDEWPTVAHGFQRTRSSHAAHEWFDVNLRVRLHHEPREILVYGVVDVFRGLASDPPQRIRSIRRGRKQEAARTEQVEDVTSVAAAMVQQVKDALLAAADPDIGDWRVGVDAVALQCTSRLRDQLTLWHSVGSA